MLSSKTCHDLPLPQRDNAAMSMGPEIRAAREAANMTQDELGKKLGVSRNAVSLWEAGTNRPSLPRIFKIMRLFGLSKLDDVHLPRSAPVPAPGQMPVDGYAAATSWQERDDLAQEPTEFINVGRDPAYPERKQYAVRVMGNSMNRRVSDGEYAICVESFGRAPRDGDVVLAQKSRDGGLVERSIKVYREADGKKQLVPDSTEDRFKSLSLDGTVEIEAFVIAYYRKA